MRVKKTSTLWIPDRTLYVISESGQTPVPAEEVIQVKAYKTDHVTLDCLWISLTLTHHGALCLSEDESDFQRLVDWLKGNGMLKDDDWWVKVVHPAFARNETVLYQA